MNVAVVSSEEKNNPVKSFMHSRGGSLVAGQLDSRQEHSGMTDGVRFPTGIFVNDRRRQIPDRNICERQTVSDSRQNRSGMKEAALLSHGVCCGVFFSGSKSFLSPRSPDRILIHVGMAQGAHGITTYKMFWTGQARSGNPSYGTNLIPVTSKCQPNFSLCRRTLGAPSRVCMNTDD